MRTCKLLDVGLQELTLCWCAVNCDRTAHRRCRPHPPEMLHRSFVAHVAGIQRGGRLEQQNMHPIFCHRLVLNAPRHNEELAFLDNDIALTQPHKQRAFDDEKELILVLMVMPDELPLQLRQLHLLAIGLTDDARTPVLGEERKLFLQIDFFTALLPCAGLTFNVGAVQPAQLAGRLSRKAITGCGC